MQKIILYTVVVLLTVICKISAQEKDSLEVKVTKSFELQAKEIANNIQIITTEEKKALKEEVAAIDKQIEEGKITKEKGDELKLGIAKERAQNIETKVAAEEARLSQLVQDKVDGRLRETEQDIDTIQLRKGRLIISFEPSRGKSRKEYKPRSERRTTTQFVFAAGLNNVVTNGESFNKSDFRVWGSHFYEWGLTLNSRILKDHNLLHAKYGLSLMYNNLRPTDNQYFVKNGDVTELQTGTVDFDESRLRNVYLTVPLHLEFDFTPKKVDKDGESYFRTHESFRVGIGGYAGVRVKSKQILKYKEDDQRIKTKQKGDFNVSDFNYGLSAYIGYGEISFYAKYDINPLFKDNAVDQNNISFGVRFDIN
ncbi:hypothetical protein DI487_09555 [Flavobacterium sediminis]|uniref:Outer membrane protein beta-barrel domain-containing protein n=1 Tax=Flavobacterium sediminis TaxID=2201181 RepID=A0A2U8QW03_9FLAO|nr:hypothetical protein [Flavobacterium sediminis]AWM14076.1 hypothetical protein DI487_09555 [Flavobacterium sediminis]